MGELKIAFFICLISATASSIPINCDAAQLRSLLQLSLESLESKETSSEEVAAAATTTTTGAPPVLPPVLPPVQSTQHATHPVITNTATGPVETTLVPQANDQNFDLQGSSFTTPPFPVNTPALESPTTQTTRGAAPQPYPLERNNSTLPGPAGGESLESLESSSEEVATNHDAPLPPVEPAHMAESTADATHLEVTNTTTGPVETTWEPQTNDQNFNFQGTGFTTSPFLVNTPALESPIAQTTNGVPPQPYPLEKNNSTLPGPARGDNV
ncbi:mucin-2-like [Sardina pilchardus]|uniref:mucin-2-like n=1 Tax=Sardina pilchardus TaxID=27697 RepID=UPI002E113E1C